MSYVSGGYTATPGNDDDAIGYTGGDAQWTWGAMGFKSNWSGNLTGFDIYGWNDTGTGSQYCIPYLYSDNAGKPNANLIGGTTFLATDMGAGAGNMGWFHITFGTPYAIVKGTPYHLVIYAEGMAGNYIRWQLNSVGDYADGIAYRSGNGTDWIYTRGAATNDALIKIYLADPTATTNKLQNYRNNRQL